MARSILTTLDFGGTSRATGLPAPANDSDAATKAYVDSAVEGLAFKDDVRVASVSNINLAAPGATVDGITMVVNDRFLVKDQSTASENGIYIWNGAAVPATRAPDADDFDKLEQAVVSVSEGSSADTSFRQTEINGTIDSSDVTWGSFGTAAPSATESVAGVIEIATQAETDAGTDNTRAITPQGLANYPGMMGRFEANIGDAAATSFNIDHNLGTRDVTVQIYRNSGQYDEVIAHVLRPTINRVTIETDAAPALNAFRVVIKQ